MTAWNLSHIVISVGRSFQKDGPSNAETVAIDEFLTAILNRRTWIIQDTADKAQFIVALGRNMKKIVPNESEKEAIRSLIESCHAKRIENVSAYCSGEGVRINLLASVAVPVSRCDSPSVSPSVSSDN